MSGATTRMGHDGAVRGTKPPNLVTPATDRALVLDEASLDLAQSIRNSTIMLVTES